MENFPTVLLEAMSAGCAVIASNTGGCPEVVGDAGLFVGPKNTQQIQEKILSLIENKEQREHLAQQALKQAQKFAWPQITQRYLDVFQDVSKKGH